MNIAPEVRVKLLRDSAKPPVYMSDSAAGLDLSACVENDIELQPGKFTSVPTGIAVAIPEGYEGEVRPRSGLAANFGVTLLNSPGTIDSDYRGEVKVIMINHGSMPFTVKNGDRIAQLLIKPVAKVDVEITDKLPETSRGSGGFGSSGR